MEHIGLRIARVRKEKGFTQDKLAKLAGITRSLLGQIETGATKPNLEFLSTFVSITNTSYEFLIDGDKSRRFLNDGHISPITKEYINELDKDLDTLYTNILMILRLRSKIANPKSEDISNDAVGYTEMLLRKISARQYRVDIDFDELSISERTKMFNELKVLVGAFKQDLNEILHELFLETSLKGMQPKKFNSPKNVSSI